MARYLDQTGLQDYTTQLTAKYKTVFATKNEVGAPLVASTAAAMTDTTKVYVYVGSESGYTSGNWYYYNGSSWVSGGVYNSAAITTDTTLTIAGMAADAKATGDAVSATNAALSEESANVEKSFEVLGIPVASNYAIWNQGSISTTTGENSSSSTRCRCNSIRFPSIYLGKISVSVASGYKVSYRKYDSGIYTGSSDWLTEPTNILGVDANSAIRFVIAKTDDSTLAPSGIPSNAVTYAYYSLDGTLYTTSWNLFYTTNISEWTTSGVTITPLDDGSYKLNGTATANLNIALMGARDTSVSNVESGKPYFFNREFVSGTASNAPFFRYAKSGTMTTLNINDGKNCFTFDSGTSVCLSINSGWSYSNAIYRFSVTQSDYPLPYRKRGELLRLTDKLDFEVAEIRKKKPRTDGGEFFTVTVEDVFPFGDTTTPTGTQEIECILRLPSSYTQYGKPTRLVLVCHGSGSYIKASTGTWGSSSLTTFVNSVLSAGYACFDANNLPTVSGNESTVGENLGSPIYVNILKKAYDYIVENYNVYPEILVHGISMGGIGATGFANAYPNVCIAQSSFAGRDAIKDYLYYFLDSTLSSSEQAKYATAYGYASRSAAVSDKLSHLIGAQPSLSICKVDSNGALVLPPDRETDFDNWTAYYLNLYNLGQNDDAGRWIGKRSVPYKAWNSWGDNVHDAKLETVLAKAYNLSSSCPYYAVTYSGYNHSQMCYGTVENMINQLLAWWKQWE